MAGSELDALLQLLLLRSPFFDACFACDFFGVCLFDVFGVCCGKFVCLLVFLLEHNSAATALALLFLECLLGVTFVMDSWLVASVTSLP